MASVTAVPTSSVVGAGRHNVFVYGTLLENEILVALLKRIPRSSTAVLHGYQRRSIKGCSYPAIIPVESKKVDGKILLDISDTELHLLDALEDFEYERSVVEVASPDLPGFLLAYTYVWVEKDDPRLKGDWHFDEWKEKHLGEFLQLAGRFSQYYEHSTVNVGRMDFQLKNN